METRTYRVYGEVGHWQRVAIGRSTEFFTQRGTKVVVRRQDVTNTFWYVELAITADKPLDELRAQLDDGVFEGFRYGRITRLVDADDIASGHANVEEPGEYVVIWGSVPETNEYVEVLREKVIA